MPNYFYNGHSFEPYYEQDEDNQSIYYDTMLGEYLPCIDYEEPEEYEDDRLDVEEGYHLDLNHANETAEDWGY